MIKHGFRSIGSSKHAFVNVFKVSGTDYKNVRRLFGKLSDDVSNHF